MSEQAKLNVLVDKYKDFSSASGLPVKKERMSVAGFRSVKVDKKALINTNKSGMIIDEKIYPKTLAGAKRGKTMDFEQANGNRANPNYFKGNGYDINCQSCVVSNEARRRGYDVETLPNTEGSTLRMLSRATNKAWIDPKTGKPPTYIFDDKITTAKGFYKFLDQTIKEKNRYTLQFAWKGIGNGGHIICVDKLETGALRLYDPQTGKAYTGSSVVDYLKEFKYQLTRKGIKIPCPPKILRIDDKEFNIGIVNDIMKEVINT